MILYEIPRLGKCIGTEHRLEVTRDCKEGEIESYCLIVSELLFGRMKKF